jgi:hypothetical protein
MKRVPFWAEPELLKQVDDRIKGLSPYLKRSIVVRELLRKWVKGEISILGEEYLSTVKPELKPFMSARDRVAFNRVYRELQGKTSGNTPRAKKVTLGTRKSR